MSPRMQLWPWSSRAALLMVPVTFLGLLLLLAATRADARWPGDRHEGWVLLGLLVLSLLPVILLLAETLATTGGAVTLPGVSVSFARTSELAASGLRSTTLAGNLGGEANDPLAQTSLRSILRALRAAHDSDVTVVDLRQGRTWWETRLFILVAGAARQGRPQAIAFVGDRNAQRGVFLGWAAPARLRDVYAASVPDLGQAYTSALARAAQWQLGQPGPTPLQPGAHTVVTLPWNGAQLHLPPLVDDVPDPAFAFELFLQQELDHRTDHIRQHVTTQRLFELFDPVLITDGVDVDAADDAWARVLAARPQPFFALTSAGTLKSLVPRDALMAALVARLVTAQDRGTSTPPGAAGG